MVKLVVSGGGTGGHIYPALSVIEAAQSDGAAQVRYIGAVGGMEASIVSAASVEFHGVTARKLTRLVSIDTLGVAWSLLKGYREARALLRADRPDVVLGTGGYVAAATVLAAQQLGIPTVIHEQNAVPGRTNRLLARRATRVCISFEASRNGFGGRSVDFTGLPVRSGIVSKTDKSEARKSHGLDPGIFTVLVLGGSQGARQLNHLVLEAVPLLGEGVQILHQTGRLNLRDVSAQSGISLHHRPVAYLEFEQLVAAFAAADLVVSRCGASTLAEVTANSLPAVLVPFPAAYADHQTANARAMEEAGAGILCPEATLTGPGLARVVQELVAAPDRLAGMAAASGRLGRPDAAMRVWDIVRQCGGRS